MTQNKKRKSTMDQLSKNNYEEIFDAVYQRYGLNLNYYKPATVSRRIERRMKLLSHNEPDKYLKLLRNNAEELDNLYGDLMIGVTDFFRDKKTFDNLKKIVLPKLFNTLEKDDDLRIWVAGCATGQEAYSIMIALCEELSDDRKFSKVKMFASDSFKPHVDKASQGLYSESEIKSVPDELLSKYFTKKGDNHYQISSNIRNKVVFSHHDITSDPPFTRLHMVSCRNLLIYFNNEARLRALSTFHFTLQPEGLLFLGNSESVTPLESEFVPIDRKHNIYKRTPGAIPRNSSRFPIKSKKNDFSFKNFNRSNSVLNDPRLMRAYDILLERFMPCGFLLNNNKEIVHSFGDTSWILNPRTGRMSLNILSLVDENISIALSDIFRTLETTDEKAVTCNTKSSEGTSISITADNVSDSNFDTSFTLLTLKKESEKQVAKALKTINIDINIKQRVANLEQELFYTREHLQSTIEELESSNEELLASSEEIQSTNEELNSTNEELYTVNKELEEKIHQLTIVNNDLNNFINSTRIATIFLDNENLIRKYTGDADEIFDILPQDISRPITHINSRLTNIDLVAKIEKVKKTGKLVEEDIEIQNGINFLLKIHPYLNDTGKIEGTILVFINIDVLRKTQEAYRKSEAKFKHVFRNMANAAAILEPVYSKDGVFTDFRFARINSSYEKMFNVEKEAAIGNTILEVFPELDPSWIDFYFQVSKTGEQQIKERYNGPMDKYLFTTCFKPEKDEGYICVTHLDLTEQKNAEVELRHAEKLNAVGQLAGGVAHDFNNQLTGILGYASLILQNPNGKKTGDFASQILKAAERSADLTQKLLAFSRKGKMNNSSMDINDEIIEVVQLLKHSIDKKIKLELNLNEGPCTICGDSGQVQNALLNLCLNARDAMKNGGILKITSNDVTLDSKSPVLQSFKLSSGKYIKIEVSDTGIGMPESVKKRIFEPFFTTKEQDGGVGMGLAAVFGTVRGHNGAITVKSIENKGSTFSLYLPCNKDFSVKDEKSSVSTMALENLNVMVIDDENIVRSIIVEMLKLQKAKVIECPGYREALETYKEKHREIDLVFIDMIMPEKNGLETFRDLKKIDKNIRAIVLSGYTMNDEISQTLKEGAVGFVQKPVSMKVLIASMKDALSASIHKA